MSFLSEAAGSAFWFVIVLGVLVFFHEFGHYAVAKLLGIRVEVFSLGFGPKLFARSLGASK